MSASAMSTYEKYISAYPQVLFLIILIICYVYHVSYVYAFIGYFGNTIINNVLKQVFRYTIGESGARPTPYQYVTRFDNAIVELWPQYINNISYGFPSGHAQSVGYFMAFAHKFLPWRTWHPAYIVVALVVAMYLMHTRIVFQRHTAIQVLFGFAFGVITFKVFNWIWTRN